MDAREVRSSVQDLLAIVEGPNDEALDLDRDLRALIERLAEHAAAVAPAAEPLDREPPREDSDYLRRRVAPRFRNYGPYHAPVEGRLVELEARDAIDDLVTLALELGDVAWLFANATEADALARLHRGHTERWRETERALRFDLDARIQASERAEEARRALRSERGSEGTASGTAAHGPPDSGVVSAARSLGAAVTILSGLGVAALGVRLCMASELRFGPRVAVGGAIVDLGPCLPSLLGRVLEHEAWRGARWTVSCGAPSI